MSVKKKICIVDYGFGNISSLENTLSYLKLNYTTLKKPKNLNQFSHLFLPGVGSFEAGIKKLKKLNWEKEIKEFAKSGGYIFGICLGMQLLFKRGTNEKTSEEIDGLGILDGKCEKFFKNNSKYKLPLPHVGFNAVEINQSRVWQEVNNPAYFYFIHSFRIKNAKKTYLKSFTVYGEKFISFIENSNIFAAQFHPEKSHSSGLKLIENFCKLK